jgi:hypothetical protein
MLRRTLEFCAVVVIVATQCGDAWARGGRGSGHAGHVGRSGGGFAAPRGFVSRTVFFAAPVAYFRPAYYAPPPDYYYPPFYYEPIQPPVYYEQPVQSALPPGGFYPPPPPAYNYPRSYYEPAQTPIYFCKDSRGRTHITNRKEATVGKDCDEEPVQSYPPSSGAYPPPTSSAAPASPRGPYAAQDALRYRSYCPDTRKYYPDVKTCASAWLKVVPDGVPAPR